MKQVVSLSDLKGSKFLDRLSKWWRWIKAIRKKKKKSFQKTFKKHLRDWKEVVLCTRFERHADTVSQTRRKQEEHVPRHIELTAVLREILRQRIESNRIERFE
jgi:hypothetical protein